MAHYIRGYIADAIHLRPLATRFATCQMVHLRCALGLVPLTERFSDEIREAFPAAELPGDWPIKGAMGPLPAEAALSAELSRSYPIVYIETDYLGGHGHQSAVGWRDGVVGYPPAHTKRPGAINGALAFLGVRAAMGCDEFDVVGLGHIRYGDDLEEPDCAYFRETYLDECDARWGRRGPGWLTQLLRLFWFS